jgi:hypothetical protein
MAFEKARRELLGFRPARTPRKRDHDMKALSAGRLQKRKAERLEVRTYVARRTLDGFPSDVRRRIEIEDQPVRVLHILHRRIPRMEFDRAHLHQRDQPLRIIHVDVSFSLPMPRDLHAMNMRRHAVGDMTLKETLTAGPIRTGFRF